LTFFKSGPAPGFATGRPRIAADVATAEDLPRGAAFFVTFFFAITISVKIFAANQSGQMLQRGGNVAKRGK
jgi:hypothetical protein